jgi:apolipoprotein N-acyltransferase
MSKKGRIGLQIAAAVATGLMVAGLFPPFSFAPLVWIAFLPLLPALWMLEGKHAASKGFALGFVAGTVSCAIQFSWLSVVSVLGAVVLPLYLACFWGLFGAFAATLGNPWRGSQPIGAWAETTTSLRVAFSHGAVWAGLELLRGWLFTGFGWNALGVAFHETLAMAQAADLLGVAGLSLLVVFFQTVLVQAGRRVLRGGKRAPRWDFGVAALTVASLLCYGIVRMATEGRGPSIRLKSLLVQINIPQDAARVLWDSLDVHQAYEDETLQALEILEEEDTRAIRTAIDQSTDTALSLRWPDWVLWPETALTGRIFRADDGSWGMWQQNIDTIQRVRSAGDFHLIYGVNELEADSVGGELVMKPKARAYNSIAYMSPDDELQTFRKHHLVIFGETIPFVETVPFLKKIYEQQAGVEYGGSFTPGESFDPVPVVTHGVEIGTIPTVCFEDTVPRLTRKFVRSGPQVIVNVTNDGWFKESAAAAQHFANARFRAIELRRPMLRCANSGVSAAIDSRGSTAHPDTGASQILTDENGSHFTRGWLLTELDIPLTPSRSLYATIGDHGIAILAAIGLGLSIVSRRQRSAPVDPARIVSR